jgi:hypothetical protein
MEMRYYYNPGSNVMVRCATNTQPTGFTEVSPEQAARLASILANGWCCMPIQRDDINAISGIGWEHFCWEPTPEQQERAKANHGGRTLAQLAESGGLRWEEIWAILTNNPWRRLPVMRAFTMCRDWPKSLP